MFKRLPKRHGAAICGHSSVLLKRPALYSQMPPHVAFNPLRVVVRFRQRAVGHPYSRTSPAITVIEPVPVTLPS